MWVLGNLQFVVNLLTSLTRIMPNYIDEVDVTSTKINNSIDHSQFIENNEGMSRTREHKFPSNFLFGAATSAYQIEGAWNVSDKSESNWDFMIHQWPHIVIDGSNADLAANSYYMYKTDISFMKQIGANAYRMSLSWPRILPTGFSNQVSKDGIRFYNDVINELLANGIEPHVTIFHWDLPQTLQELGGWTNPLIVDWYVEYARVAFATFGDRVKHWSTINEPSIHCAYDWGDKYVPATHQSGIADYLCGHYSLLAHSKAYRMYNEEFRKIQNGHVGICLSLQWGIEIDTLEITEGTERWFQWFNNWFLHPLFTDQGDYPLVMKQTIADNSYIQGFTKSRLPEFSRDEIELIKYSADFLGVNFYSALSIEKFNVTDKKKDVSFYNDIGMKWAVNDTHPSLCDAQCTPWALVLVMQRLKREYNIPMFFITENGYSDAGQLDDISRARYYYEHLIEVSNLIAKGIDIRGYFAWSLFDNFEWTYGYTRRYGIFSIDINDTNRTRIPKMSTKLINQIYKTKTVPEFPWPSRINKCIINGDY